jgi:hypothetical protein
MLLKSNRIPSLKFILSMMVCQSAAAHNCLVLQSTNVYGDMRSQFDQNSCFDVQIVDLSEVIAHVKSNIVGFTFNFKDGKSQSFIETSGCTKNIRIDLLTNELIGGHIYVGEGIEGLQFKSHDWSTNQETLHKMMGQSSGCFSSFDSNSLKINFLKIDSIHGCIDKKGSNYFPFLSFSYSFSQCPFRNSLATVSRKIPTSNSETSTIFTSTVSATTTYTTTSSTITLTSTMLSTTTHTTTLTSTMSSTTTHTTTSSTTTMTSSVSSTATHTTTLTSTMSSTITHSTTSSKSSSTTTDSLSK